MTSVLVVKFACHQEMAEEKDDGMSAEVEG